MDASPYVKSREEVVVSREDWMSERRVEGERKRVQGERVSGGRREDGLEGCRVYMFLAK